MIKKNDKVVIKDNKVVIKDLGSELGPFKHNPDLDFGLYMVTFDVDDEEIKIVSFYGFEKFPNNFAGCMKKQNMIANKFESSYWEK